MDTTVSQMQWLGIDAYMLVNESLKVVMVPEMGGKIVSLEDRRSGTEWLMGAGKRPFQPVEYGAVFTDQDMSGWDEMFPTITTCTYPGPGPQHGVNLPDHGEVWAMPWEVSDASDGKLTLGVNGRALPYRLARTADFPKPGALRLRYRLQNLGKDAMPYLWAAHPQFTCDQNGEIVLPDEVKEVMNAIPAEWGWGEPETRFPWPGSSVPGGSPVRINRVGPPDLKRARKIFALPEVRPSWAEVRRCASGEFLRFEWDPEQIPYLGIWVDEGAISQDSVVALEPMTAWYDNLSFAYRKGRAMVLPAGEHVEWSLTVRLGSRALPCA